MVINHPLSNEPRIDLQLARDEQALQPELGSLADWAGRAARQPDYFWSRQQARIRERIAESERRSRRTFLRIAWSTSLALVVTAVILLQSGSSPMPPQAQVDSDHELLLEVERVMQSDGPASLEPASVLVREISQSTSDSNPPTHKENSREN